MNRTMAPSRGAAAGIVLALALACGGDEARRGPVPPPDSTAAAQPGVTSLNESARPASDASCATLADGLRRQFGIVELEAECRERTAHVDIVDPSLTTTLARESDSLAATEAAAEVVARSVWARVGLPARLAAVYVTISGVPLDSAASATVNTFGRGLMSGWTPATKDTTERCLTSACR